MCLVFRMPVLATQVAERLQRPNETASDERTNENSQCRVCEELEYIGP